MCLWGGEGVDSAVAGATRFLAEAETPPNSQRLLGHGAARQVGDILAAGSESSIEKRLQSFVDAGTTDISIRVVPIGDSREARLESMQRTRAFLSSLS